MSFQDAQRKFLMQGSGTSPDYARVSFYLFFVY